MPEPVRVEIELGFLAQTAHEVIDRLIAQRMTRGLAHKFTKT